MTTPAEDRFPSLTKGENRAAPNAPVAAAVSVPHGSTRTNTAVIKNKDSDLQSWPDDEPSEANPTYTKVPPNVFWKNEAKDNHKSASSTPHNFDDMDDDEDSFDIEARFYRPHLQHFSCALEEIRQGQKESHWMWYLVPTPPFLIDGVEVGSSMNRRYALRSDAEVIAYLQFTKPDVDLRKNYVDLAKAIAQQLEDGNSLTNMFRYGDHNKVLSSLKLFERVGTHLGDQELFLPCRKILALVEKQGARRHPQRRNDPTFWKLLYYIRKQATFEE
eukprot:scaffold36008_cov183-Amphora_coffeaeformis.AAC.2